MANLHLVTGYAGKVHVTAEDQASLYAALFGADAFVLDRGNKLAATVVTNNSIKISDGDAIFQGRHVRLGYGQSVGLTIENGAVGQKRNDLIVIRYSKTLDTGVEGANLVVIKGTATTGTASDPEYTSANIFDGNVLKADMPLYRVPLDGLNVQELVPLFTVFGAIPAQVQNATSVAEAAAKTASTAKDTAAAAMPKSGGAFTGNITAATSTSAEAMVRNIVVVEKGTDLSTLSVPAGTIIMVKK